MQRNQTLELADWRSEGKLSRWLEKLSIPDAPVRRVGLRTALQFFSTYMPSLHSDMALNFVAAMDLSRRVAMVTLCLGEKVIAFRDQNECEYKLFYARSGASKYSSGISPVNRIAVQYSVTVPVVVLESYTTGTVDVWSISSSNLNNGLSVRHGAYGTLVAGGGLQLIIPNASRYLAITQVATTPRHP